jgi:hypothetical protein
LIDLHRSAANWSDPLSALFTLQELKQLRIRQQLPPARSQVYDGLFEIPTLTELLELQVEEWNTQIAPALRGGGGGGGGDDEITSSTNSIL